MGGIDASNAGWKSDSDSRRYLQERLRSNFHIQKSDEVYQHSLVLTPKAGEDLAGVFAVL